MMATTNTVLTLAAAAMVGVGLALGVFLAAALWQWAGPRLSRHSRRRDDDGDAT